MARTISIPVDLPRERFLSMMGMCADVFNAHSEWAKENRSWSKRRAHQDLYAELRSEFPQLPSAMVQSMRDCALEAAKSVKLRTVSKKKRISGIRYDRRTMTIRGEQMTLSCVGGRVRVILGVPDHFREVFDTWTHKGGTVTCDRKGRFWVRLVYETNMPPKVDGRILGIDLDIRNHVVSKELANRPGVSEFAMEKGLVGLRRKRRGKRMNRAISSWSFGQLREFLTYKAEALGKSVFLVDARYTSQRCCQCGHTARANRVKSRFKCRACGFSGHGDVVGATNIRDNLLISRLRSNATGGQAVVNRPNATGRHGLVASHQLCVGVN